MSKVIRIFVNDWHVRYLWLRALEFEVGCASVLVDGEVNPLFARYRSPWSA